MILPEIKLIEGKIFGRFVGMAIPPFLIIVSKKSRDPMKTIRHEWTHYLQALELWVIGFYLVYAWEWIRAGFKYRDNRLEKEAHDNDENPLYNGQRKPFAWKQY